MLPLGVCAAVFLLRLGYLSFANDHFDRISKGRQILAFGAVPFRDFFDPGFFLTLYSSAAAQAIFGDTLLGEALLTVAFISAGSAITFVLARQIAGSAWVALAVTAAAVLTFPRLYNYDKVLFFPLGIFLAWRYIARPTAARLALMAAAAGVAALYRYDSAVYVGLAAIAAVAAVNIRAPRRALTHAGLVVAGILLTIAPALVFVGFAGDVTDAFRQIAAYARREATRSEIFQLPHFAVDRSAPWVVRGQLVAVRWRAGVSDEARAGAEQRYTLDVGVRQDGRTWAYRLIDSSVANVEALVTDPLVEDTHGIDRDGGGRGILPRYALFPGVVTLPNAAAWLAWVLLALPIVTCLICAARGAPDRWPLLVSASALCLSADLALLRDPFEARIGDVAAPAVPLAAWLLAWLFRGDWASPARHFVQSAAGAILLVTAVAIAPFATPIVSNAGSLSLERLGAAPPSPALMPSTRMLGVVEYLRECARPHDRVLIAGFAPEVFFFAGRGFAGGMSVFFGGHWSSAGDQRTTIARLDAESAPLAILPIGDYGAFRRDFALIDAYLKTAYDEAAQSDMGNPEGEYRILLRRGADVTGRVPPNDLPCLR